MVASDCTIWAMLDIEGTGEPVDIDEIAAAPGSGYPEAELSSAIALLLSMRKHHRKRKASEM